MSPRKGRLFFLNSQAETVGHDSIVDCDSIVLLREVILRLFLNLNAHSRQITRLNAVPLNAMVSSFEMLAEKLNRSIFPVCQ